jgi:CubicO group peptidase (beta-lactamase class C family)
VAALDLIDGWDVPHAAAAVVADGVSASRGDVRRTFPWASVTKLPTALAVLVAAEEGIVDLDEAAGPPGATVRHLLAHASGLPFEGDVPISRPGERRIYSNTGFDLLGALVAERAAMPFADYLDGAVLSPLRVHGTRLAGRPSAGLEGPLADLVAIARELLRPALVAPETFFEATTSAFPGLAGVLPGIGRFDPLDWGLGFELKDGKDPHWSGSRTSPRTFGHFGGSGTFLWVDPGVGVALACLTDREFGDWALDAWPALSDAVLAELRP